MFGPHPPDEIVPSAPENTGSACGAVLLPGVTDLGLSHRGGGAETDAEGSVTKLLSGVDNDPSDDPDLAVLATLFTA